MMLRGAAKTQTEQTAQIHPMIETLRNPSENRYVKSMIIPYSPTLNRISSFDVYICKTPK